MGYILEIIENLERSASSMGQVQQVSSGIVCILIGLVSWLAGLKLKRILVPLAVMAAAGLICYFLKGKNVNLSAVVAAVAFIIAIILQFILISDSVIWNWLLSFVFSVLGAVLFFTGLILLISYKGSDPAYLIRQRQNYYAAVFVLMVVFGAIVQVLLFTGVGKYVKSQPTDDIDKGNSQGE
jgi:hypothetical protein